jgi:hypothetical protein
LGENSLSHITSEMNLNFPDCWSVFIKYLHAHILCKWFNSVTFVNYYRATYGYWIIKELLNYYNIEIEGHWYVTSQHFCNPTPTKKKLLLNRFMDFDETLHKESTNYLSCISSQQQTS